jgi:predicted phage terminase large subunit-like protein
MKDAQPSFVALGMASGFVGRGLDNLFIDDPYASADEARSPAINDRTWRWWEDTASPRLSSESNVLVVYHRYSMDDLGARLLAQGGWENVRFPMIADDNPDGDDPTNPSMRIKGQLLSPIRTLGWVEQQREKAPGTFFAQFQGTPLLGDATVFNVAKLRKVPMSELPKVLSVVRSWDFAASDGKGDWTVGVKFGIDFNNNNTCYILDVTRTRKATSERDELILETALTDGYEVPICIPQDPAAAGLSVIDYLTKKLAGFIVNAESVSGDKVLKATPLAGQLNIGNVLLVEGSWNKDFEDEFRSFPLGKHDDQVDSTAQAFNHLIRFPRTTISINSQREILNVQAAGTQTMGTRKIVDENGITSVLPFRNRNFSTRRFL